MFTCGNSVGFSYSFSSLTRIVLVENKNSKVLKMAYNSCLKELLLFRREHVKIVTR